MNPRQRAGQVSEVGAGRALTPGDRGDAGGWRPDQGGRQNELRGFLRWVCTKLEEGWRIDSCYEAGASGNWLHCELVDLGRA